VVDTAASLDPNVPVSVVMFDAQLLPVPYSSAAVAAVVALPAIVSVKPQTQIPLCEFASHLHQMNCEGHMPEWHMRIRITSVSC
jgi:hypothetical protein